MAEDWEAGGFGIYFHWPFCAAKCPYCDFNSHVSQHVDQDRWRKALIDELRRLAGMLGTRRVASVFFGGGTPSLMPADTVGALIGEVAALFQTGDDLEVTLEANPTSVEAERFRGYRDAGVNRFSLGVQSLVDSDLKRLGRLHSADEALAALDIAQSTGARLSIDLIYGRQHQRPEDWRLELETALATGVEHVSAYQLTIEPMTRFGELHARGKLGGLPGDDISADFYGLTEELCRAHGLLRYEVSNYAAPGQECRHNLIYWQYGDFLGVGPGAHGRMTMKNGRFASRTVLKPDEWLARVEDGAGGATEFETLSGQEQAVEYALMSLRTRRGLSVDRAERLHAGVLNRKELERLAGEGFLKFSEGNVSVTGNGILILNSIVAELV